MSPYPTPEKPDYSFRRLLGIALLFTILSLALFVRVYQIQSIPGGLYPDEATNGIDALKAIETGDYKLFYPNNYGREGLFINLQALAVKYFGNTVPVLKFWSAIFGTLAVLGIYLLGKELFQRRSAGLIAAFLLATSFWAINFSRIGFRAIMVTFLLTFAFYFFFKGLRTERVRTFLIAGLIFGIGVHTYVAYRLAPLILIALLPFLILSYENFLKRFWKHGLAFILGALITALPLIFHFANHPEELNSRTGAVSIFSPEINKGDFWGTFAKTLGLSLVKYNFWGDQNWRHNYPPYPILDPFTGIFFITAFGYLWYDLVRRLGRRFREKIRDPILVRTVFLLSFFLVMLMPEFLTEEGLPHALRSIGTQAPVFLMATMAIMALVKYAKKVSLGTRLALFSLIFLALFLGATINLTKYFVFFAKSPTQMGAFNKNFSNMAEYIMALPAEKKKYIVPNGGGRMIDNGLPVSAQPIVFLTHGKADNVIFLQDDTVLQFGQKNIIILMQHDATLLKKIEAKIPGSIQEKVDLYPGTGSDFTVVHLP
ncbi:MAG: phospholipid carrier-dependent glycosyltransferase [Candidatus Moraniibacteriota bacterium]|nr:MAG: phospholipid carrier-dependent glycosyltransferase [Candidatus Moranbacteria bacterium]